MVPAGSTAFRTIEPKHIDEEMNGVSKVIARFFRESDDEGDRRVDAVPIGAFDSLQRLDQVQLLVDDLLQPPGAGLDAKEDACARLSP